jgi:hypothetical protein
LRASRTLVVHSGTWKLTTELHVGKWGWWKASEIVGSGDRRREGV